MTREIRVVYRDRDIAGLRETRATPGQWVFFTTAPRLPVHVTVHDPSDQHTTGVIRASSESPRMVPSEPRGVLGILTVGDSVDDATGKPLSEFTGLAREQDRLMRLATLVGSVHDDVISAYEQASGAATTQLILQGADLDMLTIEAFLVPPRAQAEATAERHFPDDTFEVMVIESSGDVGMMLRVRFKL